MASEQQFHDHLFGDRDHFCADGFVMKMPTKPRLSHGVLRTIRKPKRPSQTHTPNTKLPAVSDTAPRHNPRIRKV
jgi:hypothetical protein